MDADSPISKFFQESTSQQGNSDTSDQVASGSGLVKHNLHSAKGKWYFNTIRPYNEEEDTSRSWLIATATGKIDSEMRAQLSKKSFCIEDPDQFLFLIEPTDDGGKPFVLLADFDEFWKGKEVVDQPDVVDDYGHGNSGSIRARTHKHSLWAKVITKRGDGTFNVSTTEEKISMTSRLRDKLYNNSFSASLPVEIDFGSAFPEFGVECRTIQGTVIYESSWDVPEFVDDEEESVWLLHGEKESNDPRDQPSLISGDIYHLRPSNADGQLSSV